MLSAKITDARSVDEIVGRLKAYLDSQQGISEIVAGAYDRNLVEGGRFEAKWLDQVSTVVPIVLHANDHHTIWVNTAGLKLAGLNNVDGTVADLPKLSFGSIDVDHAGRPTGVLREDEAKQLVLSRIAQQTEVANLQALLAAQKQLLAWGISKVTDAYVDDEIALAYLNAIEANALVIDFDLLFAVNAKSLNHEIASAVAYRNRLESIEQGQVRLTGVKIFADGVLGSSTAAVRDSYLDSRGAPTGNHGDLMWSDHELESALSAAAANGLDVHIHAIGDAAIDQVVRVNLQSINGPRITVAHAELADSKQLQSLANAGITVNFQPLWARPDAMMHSCAAQLGHERLEGLYRHRTALDSGLTLEFGSDWPVSDANPLLGVFTALFRRVPGTAPIHNSAEAISLTEAIAIYRSHEIVLGQRADFCTVDLDVLFRPELFATASVTQTFIGGQPKLTRQ
jgi:predicted amidohydrolase YtcJ